MLKFPFRVFRGWNLPVSELELFLSSAEKTTSPQVRGGVAASSPTPTPQNPSLTFFKKKNSEWQDKALRPREVVPTTHFAK